MSYTADTLAWLRASDPGVELFVILGSDAAAGLTTWERSEEVRDNATMVVVERPGADPVPPLEGWRWISLEVPALEVSTTDLRARAVDSPPPHHPVSPHVVARVQILDSAVEGKRASD